MGIEDIDLINELYAENPYDNFDENGLELDLQGFGSNRNIFEELVKKVRPKLIVEVGSWKGASAINMAKCLKKFKIDGKVLCVDTWLGSIRCWDRINYGDFYRSMRFKNGYPQMYYQFIYNVINNGFKDIIVPFPTTSLIAAKWLRLKKIKADLIYIDGSHEEEDVYQDLKNYSKCLSERGIIFGDDINWKSVRKVVIKFTGENRLKLIINKKRNYWIILPKRGSGSFIDKLVSRIRSDKSY